MKKSKSLESLLVIVLGFIGLFFLFKNQIFLIIALSTGVLSLLFPVFLTLLLKVWAAIGKVLGFINTNILLTLIFFLILTPLALLKKVFGKSQLQLKDNQDSYFKTRNHTFEPKDFENPW